VRREGRANECRYFGRKKHEINPMAQAQKGRQENTKTRKLEEGDGKKHWTTTGCVLRD